MGLTVETRVKSLPAGAILQAPHNSHRNANVSISLCICTFGAFGGEDLESEMRSKRGVSGLGGLGSVPVAEGDGEVVEVKEELSVCNSEPEGMSSTDMDSSSEVTNDVCGEQPRRSQDTQSMTAESLGTEWTDEKHSSYLNSMEASFVRQLQNQEFFSSHLLNWMCKKRKVLNQRSARSSVGSMPVVGQFKVLQEGCWQRLNFDNTDIQEDAPKESQELFTNPWIRHFTAASSSKAQQLTSLGTSGKDWSQAGKGPLCEWNEGVSCTSKTYLSQIPDHQSHCHLQKTSGNSKEMSDQNFADEESKDESLVKRTRMKKLRKRQNVATGVDQVVPSHQVENCDGSATHFIQKGRLDVN